MVKRESGRERLRHALELVGAVFCFLVLSHVFLPFWWTFATLAIRWVFTGDGWYVTDQGAMPKGLSPVWPFFVLFVALIGLAIVVLERWDRRRLVRKYSRRTVSVPDEDV